jgi:hypothetical protein
MPLNNLMGRGMPHLFGRYSLPDVMGRLFHRDHGDVPMTPTQYTGGLTGGSYQAPGLPPLNAPDLNIHTGDPGSYYNSTPPGGTASWQNAYGGGSSFSGGDSMTPSMTTLNPAPSYTPPDWSSYLNAPDLNIKTGNGGGSAGGMGGMGGGNGGGMYTSGTLGGGTAVDPSQWGAFGLGGDSGPANGGIGQGYALQMLSGGMHEGGGFGGGSMAGFMARPQTGGALPPQAAPNLLTGGGLPPQSMPARTGGGLPPQAGLTVRTGGPTPAQQMPQNRLGGLGGGYNFGMGGYLR